MGKAKLPRTALLKAAASKAKAQAAMAKALRGPALTHPHDGTTAHASIKALLVASCIVAVAGLEAYIVVASGHRDAHSDVVFYAPTAFNKCLQGDEGKPFAAMVEVKTSSRGTTEEVGLPGWRQAGFTPHQVLHFKQRKNQKEHVCVYA